MSTLSFDQTFQRLKRRLLAIGSLSGTAWGCFGCLLLLLAGMWMDLIWELSPASRIGALVLAVIAAVFLLGSFIVLAVRSARPPVIVRSLDQAGQTHGEIVTGYDLQATGAPAGAGLTHGLAQMAVSKAVQIASMVPATLVVPSAPVRKAVIAAVCAVTAFLAVALFSPSLAQTEWLRFADPFGDHPPFSRTQFQVEPGDTQVRYGDGMDVVVTVAGQPVDDLDLVLRTTRNGGKHHHEKLPMFSDATGHWRATISAVTQPGQYFVQARSTRSHRFNIGVITVPKLESVRFRIQPPAYTRDAVYEGPLPQGGIQALAGTEVEVRATSNRPLKGGVVDIVSGERRETVALEPATNDGTSHEVSGKWTISKAGSFHLTITDVAGQPSRESFSGAINLLQDQIPVIRIVEPAPQSLATPSVTLPVVLAAEDDYGVTRLQLFRSLNDSRPMPMSFDVPAPPARRFEQSVQLPLSAYGLQPGDVIKLFARVEDNDPAGAKGSESSVVVIQIISEEELQRMVRAREGIDALVSKYQEAQRRLEAAQEEVEQLRKKLEKRDADGALSDQEREELEKLSERLAEEAKAMRESAKHVMPYDLDKSLNDELQQLAERLEQASEAAAKQAAAKQSAGQTARNLAKMQEQLAKEKKQMKEGITDPMEKLSEIYPLLEDQNRFVELYYRQRDLAERLRSLKNQQNPDDPAIKARMRELESEQRKLREDLDELLNDIEIHAERLPADDERLQKLAQSSLEFVEAVRASGAFGAMSNAELALGEFSGERSHSQAKDAADILESFISRCQGNGQQCEGACNELKFQPGEGALGDTLNQLLGDAGFKPGMGNKQGPNGQMGAGGGYSARRGAMNRMGLYGQMPTRGNPTAARGGGKRNGPTAGGSYLTDSTTISTGRVDPHGMLKASGISESAIPSRYRGRVQEYFQRIAEEAERKK